MPEDIQNLVFTILGFSLGLLPEYLNRKRRLKTHWEALLSEVQMCEEFMVEFKSKEIGAPLYRLPVVAYQNAFPILLTDGALWGDESQIVIRFYNQVEQINRGLDYAGSFKRDDPNFIYDLSTEYDRLLVKISGALDSKEGQRSLYDQVTALIEKKLTIRWWKYIPFRGYIDG